MVTAPRHDWGFFYFAAVGFLLGFGFLTGFTVGLPLVLLGLVLLLAPRFRRFAWPADLGLVAGAGAVCVAIAALDAFGDPRLWALAGLTLVAAASFAFWWMRCR